MKGNTLLRQRRKKLHMTLQEVGDAIGVAKQTIYKYETGDISNIPSDKIERLAAVLRISPAQLMGWDAAGSGESASGGSVSGGPASGEFASGGPASGGPASGGPASGGPASGGPARMHAESSARRRPRLGTIVCGEPCLAQESYDGYDDIPSNVECDFTLVCKGDSMINARILDGDIVYIRQQPDVENGEIAAVLVGEDATLKRVFKQDGQLILMPENPRFTPMVYAGERLRDVRILGKAVAFFSRLQ